MSYFKAEMHQMRLRMGLRPRPRWESLQRSPDPLDGFKGATSKGGGGESRGWEGIEGREGREGKWRERKGRRGDHTASISKPLQDLYTRTAAPRVWNERFASCCVSEDAFAKLLKSYLMNCI